MGSGSWDISSYVSYSKSKNRMLSSDGSVARSVFRSVQDVYQVEDLHKDLNIYNKVRECRNTDEHPETKPVILAIDVTGSMGPAAIEVARTLNPLMIELYKEIRDVEFCVMGIGDLAYDRHPIQMSQFESDIRIAEHLDKIHFEGGGGGNSYESYTAAWYAGLYRTQLDAEHQGRKGVIITLGDEQINPYLPESELRQTVGDSVNGINATVTDTKDLFKLASRKFDIYHVHVNHDRSSEGRAEDNVESFGAIIGNDHVYLSNIDSLKDTVTEIILRSFNKYADALQEGLSYITPVDNDTEKQSVGNSTGMPYISW